MSSTVQSESLYRKLASQLTEPCVLSLVSDVETPVSVFHKLTARRDAGFLFESAEGDTRLARYSFVGTDPLFTIAFNEGQALVSGNGDSESLSFREPTQVLKEVLASCSEKLSADPEVLAGIPFTGGLVGYMGYAATQYFEKIKQQSSDPFSVAEGFYGLYDSMIVFDHQYRRLHVVSRRGRKYAEQLIAEIADGSPLQPLRADKLHLDGDVFAEVQQKITKEEFLQLVEKSKEYVREGQVFQIVVSHRFSVPVKVPPLDVYRVLQAINPSPYAYYLKLPGFSYIGSSPETFVRCVDGHVSLRAIAGTRPRGATAEQDAALEKELKENEKELAEHHMLVDLGRNDLGRVCQVGTVKVGEIAMLTRYTHVMHLATEISGKLQPSKTCFDAFRGCFPRGTVSGAPKVRAMQLLADLEPERRGVYSGVVGYFDFKGNMDGAIAIRSALVKDGIAHVNAGAGIVLDSDAGGEYKETRNKAKSVIKAVVAANAIGEG